MNINLQNFSASNSTRLGKIQYVNNVVINMLYVRDCKYNIYIYNNYYTLLIELHSYNMFTIHTCM